MIFQLLVYNSQHRAGPKPRAQEPSWVSLVGVREPGIRTPSLLPSSMGMGRKLGEE